jgi:hypothetical protein
MGHIFSIHEMCKQFPSLPLISHVKGHQDRDQPFLELPVIAQLNVEADALATRKLDEFGDIHPIVPFDPSCHVLLHIAGRTVTWNMERAIQEKLFLFPFRLYVCLRFGWS